MIHWPDQVMTDFFPSQCSRTVHFQRLGIILEGVLYLRDPT